VVDIESVDIKTICVLQGMKDGEKAGRVGTTGKTDKNRIARGEKPVSVYGLFNHCNEVFWFHALFRPVSLIPSVNYIMIKMFRTTERKSHENRASGMKSETCERRDCSCQSHCIEKGPEILSCLR